MKPVGGLAGTVSERLTHWPAPSGPTSTSPSVIWAVEGGEPGRGTCWVGVVDRYTWSRLLPDGFAGSVPVLQTFAVTRRGSPGRALSGACNSVMRRSGPYVSACERAWSDGDSGPSPQPVRPKAPARTQYEDIHDDLRRDMRAPEE
ncbi:hypothetical protein D7X75_24855 [Corallococcus sp. CA031C]|nr:hypothetical protein D7X75_24855 [Corallococcus sp. CA031C]